MWTWSNSSSSNGSLVVKLHRKVRPSQRFTRPALTSFHVSIQSCWPPRLLGISGVFGHPPSRSQPDSEDVIEVNAKPNPTSHLQKNNPAIPWRRLWSMSPSVMNQEHPMNIFSPQKHMSRRNDHVPHTQDPKRVVETLQKVHKRRNLASIELIGYRELP